MSNTIWITYVDRERLLNYLQESATKSDIREQKHITALEHELAVAHVYVDSDEVPADLITMRSRALLKNLATDAEMHCALVYPGESDPDHMSINVLAPLGTAMLGQRTGDTFDVDLPRGATKFRVESITYQPEAAGDFHL